MAHRYVHPEEGWNQNQQRQLSIFFDQHRSDAFPDGRPWWCYTENPANPKHPRRPVGEMIPVSADVQIPGEDFVIPGWESPWIPEPKYVAMATSTMQGNRFRFDYQRMVTDYREANTAFYMRAAREAAARNWPAPRLYGPVSFQLRAIVGNPPKSPKLPEAALAGDPWLLGFSPKVNESLRKILDEENGRMTVTLEDAGLDEVPADEKVRSGQRAAHLLGTNTNGTILSEEEIGAAIRAAEQLKRTRLKKQRDAQATTPAETLA